MSVPSEQFEDNESDDSESIDTLQNGPIEGGAEESLDWGGGELEAAYLKAMMALEASEAEMPLQAPDQESAPTQEGAVDGHQTTVVGTVAEPSVTNPQSFRLPETEPPLSSVAEGFPHSKPDVSSAVDPASKPAVDTRLTPRQILEACLFVGGPALTSKKLSGVLRGDFDSEFVDREIDGLNRLYAAECRPYEIRLGEGGYRLTLRDEFERIRHKVYGLGPKEVRLSQESLEVLAVVAYHQPIKQARVEELGKPACGAVLRQLVRRELLAVERDPADPRDVKYKTTPRFLSLFGIRNLDELPRHEQVSYK